MSFQKCESCDSPMACRDRNYCNRAEAANPSCISNEAYYVRKHVEQAGQRRVQVSRLPTAYELQRLRNERDALLYTLKQVIEHLQKLPMNETVRPDTYREASIKYANDLIESIEKGISNAFKVNLEG